MTVDFDVCAVVRRKPEGADFFLDIVAGMIIAHTLADTFAAEDILYSDSGVREGYIWKEIIGVEDRER